MWEEARCARPGRKNHDGVNNDSNVCVCLYLSLTHTHSLSVSSIVLGALCTRSGGGVMTCLGLESPGNEANVCLFFAAAATEAYFVTQSLFLSTNTNKLVTAQ